MSSPFSTPRTLSIFSLSPAVSAPVSPSYLKKFAAGVAITAGAAAAMVAPVASAATTLNVGTVVWIGYGPFYVAEAMDMCKSGRR